MTTIPHDNSDENISDSIQVKIVFFAALREQLNCNGLTIELNAPATAKDVLTALITQQPNWQSALENNTLLIAVNHDMVDENTEVKQGDEVAFFPPVTGG